MNNCIAMDSVFVGEPAALNILASIDSNVSCFGGQDGGASVVVSGGTPSYSYLWSNSTTTSFISGVGAGNYSLVVTDFNACKDSASVILNQPSKLTININIDSNISCFGYSDGALSAIISGGTPSYTYSWSNGVINSQLNGIASGLYSLTITDSNACQLSDSVTLVEPTALSVNILKSDVSCFSGNDGEINAMFSGGTTPFDISWSNGSSSPFSDINRCK